LSGTRSSSIGWDGQPSLPAIEEHTLKKDFTLKTTRAKDIYANPEIYQLLYEPFPPYLNAEAHAIVSISNRLLGPRPKLSTLEIFSGEGHFLPYLARNFAPTVIEYESLDLYAESATHKLNADSFDIPKRYDLVISTYSSIEAVGMLDVSKVFAQAYKHLKPGGIFIANRAPNTDNFPESWFPLSTANEVRVFSLLERPVVAKFVPPTKETNPIYKLSVRVKVIYDRVTGIIHCKYVKPITIRKASGGPVLGEIHVPEGVALRYMTEKEIFTALRQAGITRGIHVYSYDESEYLEPLEELPLFLTDVSTDGFGTFNWFAVVK
jgi:hypothetical protein